MNGTILLSDGYTTIENGNIVTDGNISTSNTTTSNIATDHINLNLGNSRSLYYVCQVLHITMKI